MQYARKSMNKRSFAVSTIGVSEGATSITFFIALE
jgi:hypothetical protein